MRKFFSTPVSGKTIFFSGLISFLIASGLAYAAQTNFLGVIFLADPTTPANQLKVNSDGSLTDTGNVASGAADSGNPVKVGGKYVAAGVSLSDGQRGDMQLNAAGLVMSAIGDASVPSDGVANNQFFGISNLGGPGQGVRTAAAVFNGATWDRQFGCPNFAAVSVTAGNTTQIIALSASTVIRLCTIVLTTSLTGTFTMLSGTGSNCGTPANSTGAMGIVTATPVVISDANGAVYRGTAGGEFCVAAATGNITGYVMYAQY